MEVTHRIPTIEELNIPGIRYEVKMIYTLDSEDVSMIGKGAHRDHFIEREMTKDNGKKYYLIGFWENFVTGNVPNSFIKKGSLETFEEWKKDLRICTK